MPTFILENLGLRRETPPPYFSPHPSAIQSVRRDGRAGEEKKNSWHHLLDTAISYSLANTWRGRVFPSVVEFEPLVAYRRAARIVCIRGIARRVTQRDKSHARLCATTRLIFRGPINPRRIIARPFIVCKHEARIEHSRAMSNYCACLRADVARPFFVMLKLHQCQKAGRADCVAKVSIVAQQFGAMRETCAKMFRRKVVCQEALDREMQCYPLFLSIRQ